MEVEYDIEEIQFRKQKIIDALQDNLRDFLSSDNKEEYIIRLNVNGFKKQAREFESIFALKLVLEGLIEEYIFDTEDIFMKVTEIMEQAGYLGDFSDETDKITQNQGYIYVMINPSIEGIIKIGFTKRTPEERLDELSKASGVPTPFILVYKEHFMDCVLAEKIIHSILDERGERVASNREFFNSEISEAIKVINQVKQNENIENVDNFQWVQEVENEEPISREYLEKGDAYLDGLGDCLQDYDKAIKYLEKSGDLGEAEAFYKLGMLYIDTLREDEFKLDVKQAIKYFEKGKALKGIYATYCNAGLALCYFNERLEYTKNYSENIPNAEKCWQWFFENLDLDNSDFVAITHIFDCIDDFLVKNQVPNYYKDRLEIIANPFISKCKYRLFERTLKTSLYKDIQKYLENKFGYFQLFRELKSVCISEEIINIGNEDEFEILVEQGYVEKGDYLRIAGNHRIVYRNVESVQKSGTEISRLNKGEQGLIRVKSLGKINKHFLDFYLSVDLIGSSNDKTEDKEIPSEKSVSAQRNEMGFIDKVRGWFK